MKKIFSILFLFILFVYNTGNIWILLNFHYHRDFIAQNLCINRFDKIPVCKGQCYLEKQLKEKEEKEEKIPSLKQVEWTWQICEIEPVKFYLVLKAMSKKCFLTFSSPLLKGYYAEQMQPPSQA